MRRSSAGVTMAPAAASCASSPNRGLVRVETYDPEYVVAVLEPLVTQARRTRLREVLGRRLASVSVIFDRPYDPHNGAAVLRSCEAFGVHRLHVVERPGVAFAVARSVARGADKWVEVVRHVLPASVTAWAALERTQLVVAHPEGELVPEDLRAIPRLALVLGNEREGVAPALEAACGARVRVPMRGFVESLNVSVTAAVLLASATRGRAGDLDATAQRRLYARGLYLSVPRADVLLRDR